MSSGFVFERDDLLASLVEMRELLDAGPTLRRSVAARALADSAQFIDMNECIRSPQTLMDGRLMTDGQDAGAPERRKVDRDDE